MELFVDVVSYAHNKFQGKAEKLFAVIPFASSEVLTSLRTSRCCFL